MWTLLREIEPDQSWIELFTPYLIDMLNIYFGLAKATPPRLQESDNEIPFQTRGQSAEQPVHIKNGAFPKLSNTEHITFGIGPFQVIIVTKSSQTSSDVVFGALR